MNSKTIITFLLVLLVMIVTHVLGSEGSFDQSSWYGGPGFPGPVTEWGDEFYISDDVTWRSTFYLYLGPPFKFNVDDELTDSGTVANCGDIDGDSDIDIVGNDGIEVIWWENVYGDGMTWDEHVLDSYFPMGIDYIPFDVDVDDDIDIVSYQSYYDDYIDIVWWENLLGDGSSWSKHLISDDYDRLYPMWVDDLDGDDDGDVLMGYTLGGDPVGIIRWWENVDGEGYIWEEHIIDNADYSISCIRTADINDDGDTDVIGALFTDDEIVWWDNVSGTGDEWVRNTVIECDAARSVYASDVNGDGKTDIVSSSSGGSDEVIWSENVTGLGDSWIHHLIGDDINDPIWLCVFDIDGDDDTDVAVGCNSWLPNFAWYENLNGFGTSWESHIFDDASRVQSVWFGDFDGDDRGNILTAERIVWDDYDQYLVAWWEVLGPTPPEGTLTSSILDVGEDPPEWTELSWSSETPPRTSITFWIRSSTDYTDMGEWSGEITEPCELSGYFDDEDRYIQYRVKLETEYEGVTPVLEGVGFKGYFTDIKLDSFYCKGVSNNAISVSWSVETTEDKSIAGFNLYRRKAIAAETRKVTTRGGSANKVSDGWTKLNDVLITGENPYSYIDAGVEPGVTYEYKLETVVDGRPEVVGTTTGTAGAQPAAFALYQSRPNPARGEAVISFELPEDTDVTLAVYDLSGRKVATLADGLLPAGEHERSVSALAPGVYVYRLDAGDWNGVRKMVVIE
ncbi:MAG: T9SS type A sorting domain-containing protein [Candidatus Coatesbacteria bacterium]|nr:MAG: T9SS type A sorting domain-containing protein [Candidatus Coatesbacteria bacterium]